MQQLATTITSDVQNVDTQASASLAAAETFDHKQVNAFVKKDHFAPTQKNETQLRFKITTPPGRKKQHLPLR